jgi:hypothetical protein
VQIFKSSELSRFIGNNRHAVYSQQGTSSYIVVISENWLLDGVMTLANMTTDKTQFKCRPVILGLEQYKERQ